MCSLLTVPSLVPATGPDSDIQLIAISTRATSPTSHPCPGSAPHTAVSDLSTSPVFLHTGQGHSLTRMDTSQLSSRSSSGRTLSTAGTPPSSNGRRATAWRRCGSRSPPTPRRTLPTASRLRGPSTARRLTLWPCLLPMTLGYSSQMAALAREYSAHERILPWSKYSVIIPNMYLTMM